jgi:hypothetical protein
MRKTVILLASTLFFSFNSHAQEGDPKATEAWEPVPHIITPGATSPDPPSDAIILFNGADMSGWTDLKGNTPKWKNENGILTVEKGTGNIQTKQGFGSCQLHIEWRSPQQFSESGQGRGNSGVFLMGRYEVQVLDSYNNVTYSNGQAGSIYKQFIPLVNACRPPGEWQMYDIIFTAPKFDENGSMTSPARFTVMQNGVLIQNNVELKGETVYIGQPAYKKHNDKEPLMLQEHGCAVSYRNIWIREL